MKKYLRYAAIPALLAAPAFAGNLQEPIVEPVIAAPIQIQPISDWTGFYLGGQVGYGSTSTIFVNEGENDLFTGSDDLTGGFGGLHVGYLYDIGQWVLGGELDYDWADISRTFDGFDVIGFPTSTDVKIDEIYRLKLLAGYDLGQGLIYATAGAFNANLSVDAPGISDIDDNGWLAGVGYKHKFTENWIGGVEALYHNASDFGDSGDDLKLTTISARISYQF